MSEIQKTHFADDATLERIAKLERELAEAQRHMGAVRAYIEDADAMKHRAEQAERRAAELERDARRYRWLNSQDHFMIYIAHSFDNKDIKGEKSYRLKCGEVLDSWIDARIDATIENEKGDSRE